MLAFIEAEAVRKGISVCRLESTETARTFYMAAGYSSDGKTSDAGSWIFKRLETES